MAFLGKLGVVTLCREWPEPTLLSARRFTGSAFSVADLAFQTGDKVAIIGLLGVPADLNGDGYPDAPDALSFWGDGPNVVGPVVAARTAGGAFWPPSDAQPFWDTPATTGFAQVLEAYVHRDVLDDVTLYPTEISSVNGDPSEGIPLQQIDIRTTLILRASDATGYYDTAIEALQGVADAGIVPLNEEQPLSQVRTVPAVLTEAASDPAKCRWRVQCDLTEWVLETDATQLDQDAIGQVFGEYAKGMLRGAGSFRGEVSYKYFLDEQDGAGLLRLALLTEQGSKAKARFQLGDQSALQPISGDGGPVPRKMFYETDILISQSAVNASSTDIIRMTAQFVATGAIRLVTD